MALYHLYLLCINYFKSKKEQTVEICVGKSYKWVVNGILDRENHDENNEVVLKRKKIGIPSVSSWLKDFYTEDC